MKQKGFTLIEAVFSVLISSLVITGIFSYFANSVRNVEKSEKDLNSIKQIQNLVTDLKFDLNHVTPFIPSKKISLDGYPKIERFYTYRIKAFLNSSNEAKFLELDSTKLVYESSLNEIGERQWIKSRELDNFFNIAVKFSDSWDALENAAVNLSHKLDCSKDFEDPILQEKLKLPLKVRDLYLFSNREKILYRYYPKPHYFVGRFRFNLDNELIDAKNYGLSPKSKDGLIKSFQVTPIFDHIYFQENVNEPYQLHFQKYFFRVATLVQGNSDRGPQAKPYVVNFNITNPQLNGDKYHRGVFE